MLKNNNEGEKNTDVEKTSLMIWSESKITTCSQLSVSTLKEFSLIHSLERTTKTTGSNAV